MSVAECVIRGEGFVACMESSGHSPDYTFRGILARYATNTMYTHHCAAARTIYGISTRGDIYPCSYFSGDDDYVIGSVWNGLSENRVTSYLTQTSVTSYDECRECGVRNICSGGCPVSRHYVGKMDCSLIRLEIQEGKRAFDSLMKDDPLRVLAIGNSGAAEELREALRLLRPALKEGEDQ